MIEKVSTREKTTMWDLASMLNRIATHLNKQEADTDEIIKSLYDDTVVFDVLKHQSKKDDSKTEVKSSFKCPCSTGVRQCDYHALKDQWERQQSTILDLMYKVEAKDKEIVELKAKKEELKKDICCIVDGLFNA